jgi:hypothetical protein
VNDFWLFEVNGGESGGTATGDHLTPHVKKVIQIREPVLNPFDSDRLAQKLNELPRFRSSPESPEFVGPDDGVELKVDEEFRHIFSLRDGRAPGAYLAERK